jgi:hypothetical protein
MESATVKKELLEDKFVVVGFLAFIVMDILLLLM